MTGQAEMIDAQVKAFGARLAAARQSRGLKSYELARAAGLDPVTVSNLERGNREPALRTVMALCAALRISLDIMLRWCDTPGYDCSSDGYYGPCTGACQRRPDLREPGA